MESNELPIRFEYVCLMVGEACSLPSIDLDEPERDWKPQNRPMELVFEAIEIEASMMSKPSVIGAR